MYYFDYNYYNKEIEKYVISNELVNFLLGDVEQTINLNELVKLNGSDVVRLDNNTDTIMEWEKRNSKSRFVLDFYGGGIPRSLNDFIKIKIQ